MRFLNFFAASLAAFMVLFCVSVSAEGETVPLPEDSSATAYTEATPLPEETPGSSENTDPPAESTTPEATDPATEVTTEATTTEATTTEASATEATTPAETTPAQTTTEATTTTPPTEATTTLPDAAIVEDTTTQPPVVTTPVTEETTTEEETDEEKGLFYLKMMGDYVYPSNNEFDIPTLLMDNMPVHLELPLNPWGAEARYKKGITTYHFYVDDYRFEQLFKDPIKLLQSGCRAIVEPNCSIHDQTPMAHAIWQTYRKRYLCRYLQECGMQIWVDLNVSPHFEEINALGVPEGYNAFCTRGVTGWLNTPERHWEMAKRISGLEAAPRTMLQLAAAAVVLVPYVLVTGVTDADGWGSLPLTLVLLAVVGVLHTGFAYKLYFGSIQVLPVQTAAMLSYIDPVVAILLSALLLREAMSLPQALGAVLVLGSALVGELPGKKC